MGEKGERMKDLLAKPNQLIEIEGTLNLSQLKTYNVILADIHRMIQSERKRGKSIYEAIKETYVLDFSSIKKRSGLGAKDEHRLREYIKNIKKVDISLTDKKSGDWAEASLLSQAVYKEDEGKLYITLPPIIKESLYLSNYFTTLDLLMLKTFRSKYTVVLYEVIKKYEGVEIPKKTIGEFASIFQTKYKRFSDVKRYILDIAIKEIEAKTDYMITYNISKVGRKIAHIKLKCEKKGNQIIGDILEADIVEESLKGIPQGELLTTITAKGEDKLENAILKAKRNIYISKAWNKRADNKVKAILNIHGEDYVVELLQRAYDGCQREIEKTLVQYFNGIIKNMDLELDEVRKKREKIKKKEVAKNPTKEKLVVKPIGKVEQVVSEEEVKQGNQYAIFESLNEEAQEDILNEAREYYLSEIGATTFNPVNEKIFNMTKKSYINRILSA